MLTCQSAKELFLLQADMTFLNHGSFGACPRPVFETYQAWQLELERQPVAFLGREIQSRLAHARARLAEYVGTEPDNLVFVPNATHGMNIIARSMRLAPTDDVVGSTHEYGAVERAWRFTCSQTGAHYSASPIALPLVDEHSLIDQLWAGVTDRTKVLVISHISSPTAITFPVAAICKRAAAQGIITVVDGAHAPGQLDLDLDSLGADFYVGNCHKWLCGPKGSGFLYARPERQQLLLPLIVSWGWEAENPSDSPFQDYFGWTGTDDPAAYLTIPAAIDFQQSHDWVHIRERCHALAVQAEETLGALTHQPLVYPSHEWYSQMCCVAVHRDGGVSAQSLQSRLWEMYRIEVPIIDWDSWRLVRLSIQAYNSAEDIAQLASALQATLLHIS